MNKFLVALSLLAGCASSVFAQVPISSASGNSPARMTMRGGEFIICEGLTVQGIDGKPAFRIDGKVNGVFKDASVPKVIRNCTFTGYFHGTAVRLNNAKNVIIENNTFIDLDPRSTEKSAVGVHITTSTSTGPVVGVVIRNNVFKNVKGDAIHMGDNQHYIRDVTIQNNTFTVKALENYAENAIDIKSVQGPIRVFDNLIAGFRPCKKGLGPCSGSNGSGMVVHAGSNSYGARNVSIRGNIFRNNTIGLSVTWGKAQSPSRWIDVIDNKFRNNVQVGLNVLAARKITITGTIFSGTVGDLHAYIKNTPMGGFCHVSGDLYDDPKVVFKNSNCDIVLFRANFEMGGSNEWSTLVGGRSPADLGV